MDEQLKVREWITIKEAANSLRSIAEFGRQHEKDLVQNIAEGQIPIYWYLPTGSPTYEVSYGTVPGFDLIPDDPETDFPTRASQNWKGWMPTSRKLLNLDGPLQIELDINPIFRDSLRTLHLGDVDCPPTILMRHEKSGDYYWIETREPEPNELKFPRDGVILKKDGKYYQRQTWSKVNDGYAWVPDWRFGDLRELVMAQGDFEQFKTRLDPPNGRMHVPGTWSPWAHEPKPVWSVLHDRTEFTPRVLRF